MIKKAISVFLCFVLCFSLLPLTVSAEENYISAVGSESRVLMLESGNFELEVEAHVDETVENNVEIDWSYSETDFTMVKQIGTKAVFCPQKACIGTFTAFLRGTTSEVVFRVDVRELAFTSQPAGGVVGDTGYLSVEWATNAPSDDLLFDFGYVDKSDDTYHSQGNSGVTGSVDLAPGTYQLYAQYLESSQKIFTNEFIITATPLYSVTVYGGTADPVKAEENTTVTVTANVLTGKAFERWVIVEGGPSIDDLTSSEITFLMPACNVVLDSEFYNEPINGTEDIPQGRTIQNNNGNVERNEGTLVNNNVGAAVVSNEGTVVNNAGTVSQNRTDGTVTNNLDAGTVTQNYGEITNNAGTVTDHFGTVVNNLEIGTIANSAGTVIENAGTVTNNLESGCVKSNTGSIPNNSGAIDNNNGTVENNYDVGRIGANNEGATVTNNAGTIAVNAGTVESNYPGGTVTVNGGTVTANGGTVSENNGTVGNNSGTVAANNGTVENSFSGAVIETNGAGATVTNNAGTVTENAGTVANNLASGAIAANSGTIANNAGSVSNNTGEITENLSGASVAENNGTIRNNKGTVTVNHGTIYESADMLAGQAGINSDTGVIILIPANDPSEELSPTEILRLAALAGGTVITHIVTYTAGSAEGVTGETVYVSMTYDADGNVWSITLLSDEEASFTRLGYRLAGWSVTDGGSADYELGEAISSQLGKQLTLYPAWDKAAYQITAGGGQILYKGIGAELAFTCSGAADSFIGLLIDGASVDTASYTVKSGSTVLTLLVDYSEALEPGEHTVQFLYADGESNVETFTVNTAIADVIEKINAIGEVEYTDECKRRIDDAREAYDALTEEKALVPEDVLQKLLDAEAAYEALKPVKKPSNGPDTGDGESNDETFTVNTAIADVIEKINAIGEVEYTDECKRRIDDAREAYDALTEEKALVPEDVLQKLLDAEAAYEALKPVKKPSNGPATGDGASVLPWLLLAFLSCAVLTVTELGRGKKYAK